MAVNCAAFPENLLESELFGYEEGAFTGARRGGKAGLFELASKGTIFLDEVEELSLGLQVRLLRALQEKEIMRVGGNKLIPVDIRVIAATNQDLTKFLKEGKFRSDLYFRLNVLPLNLPPLKDRGEDIILLFKYFLGSCPCPPEEKLKMLLSYSWPGNVRELLNFVSRYAALKEENPTSFATFSRLVQELKKATCVEAQDEYIIIHPGSMKEMEVQLVEQLSHIFSNKSRLEIANLLGVSRTTLWRKLTNAK